MACGDHFFVWRQHKGIPFQHHGIDLGDGTVVHFTDGDRGVAGPGGGSADFQIRQTPQEVVTRGGRDEWHVIQHRHRLAADVVVQRALSQVGRQGYDLIFDNCEHFACWCVVDRPESRQVAIACQRAGAASFKAVASGAAHVCTKWAAKRLVRGVSPWLLVADAAQWATEAGGHHLGLTNPQTRTKAGRAIGGATALGVGALGGPVGVAFAGGVWVAGELAGEASHHAYRQVRKRRLVDPPQADPASE
jgi:hypothetical protein